jgi:LuxR family transcriptional regulator, maltose regulon positive regulatory protein
VIAEVPSLDGRRAPNPPACLRHELARAALVAALEHRFDVPITVLTAGAGFGKTTALAQSIRANIAKPMGIDAWVSCEANDEDDRRLGAAILHALGAVPAARSPLQQVLYALNQIAPVDVCVVIDDLHELASDSPGERLVAELARNLPAHAHLVLATRIPITVPLARLRAAGRVVELDHRDLAFTADEVAALARLHGSDTVDATELAGWPSLVQLALSARPGAAVEFLWEEIVTGLDPPDRIGLLALATLGWGSIDDIRRVAGGPVDVNRLARVVPLLYARGDGRYEVHQLWEDAVGRVFEPDELLDVRRRALATIDDRGEILRLGTAAVRWADAEWLRRAAVALVGSTWGALPISTAERWVHGAGKEALAAPELRLLQLAIRQARSPHDETLDDDLESVIDEFGQCGHLDGLGNAIALGAIIAHGRGDLVQLHEFAHRARALPTSSSDPKLRFFVGAADAAVAAVAGDAQGCLGILNGLRFDRVPRAVGELVLRLRVTMLMIAGRSDEAVEMAAPLAGSDDEYVRSIPAFLRWHSGDPSQYLAEPLRLDDTAIPHSERIGHAAEMTAIAASLGNEEAMRHACEMVCATPIGDLDARRSAFSAMALAVCAVVDRNEVAAAAILAAHLDRHRESPASATLHLRRHLALSYVCSPELRVQLDAADLGPVHRHVRDAARSLLDVRSGTLDRGAELPTREFALTAFPLVWTVELGVGAHALGHPDATEFIRGLAELLPDASQRQLARIACSDDHALADAAREIGEMIPSAASSCLQISVIGTMQLAIDGETVTPPELGRARVRTVLALLVARGPLRRDQILDAVWPDAEVESARRNLRVTLTRLRRLLDPHGTAHPPGHQSADRLRTDRDIVALAAPPHVDTDLWAFRRHLAAIRRVDPRVESIDLTARLTEAFALCRGEPLTDLVAVTGFEPDIEELRRELVEVGLELGELNHVAGRFDGALQCAERCLSLSPYLERAHRLAIAAQLQRRDRSGLAIAVRKVTDMLADFGVEAEPSTQMLLRRAAESTSLP